MKFYWSRTVVVLLYLSMFACLSDATLSKKDRKKKIPNPIKESKETLATVKERGLVVVAPKWKDIVLNHDLYSTAHKTVKDFAGLTLGYVTPWNNHGYDTAQWFASKFTHLSPVWLQIRRVSKAKYELTGTHDIDRDWMTRLKTANELVRIVPRVLFDSWTKSDYLELFSNSANMALLGKSLAQQLKSHGFDGAVLEIWSQLGGHHRNDLANVIKVMAKSLHSNSMQLILVIPARKAGHAMFDSSDFSQLLDHVDAFSLMTYDYSQSGSPGANSPIDWVEEVVVSLSPSASPARQKILLGLNFYGYDFTGSNMSPIVGPEYLKLLQSHKPKLQWDSHCAEHHFQYKSGAIKHEVYYPSLKSLASRLSLAEDLGTGVSVWELGQGLDYFYDIL